MISPMDGRFHCYLAEMQLLTFEFSRCIYIAGNQPDQNLKRSTFRWVTLWDKVFWVKLVKGKPSTLTEFVCTHKTSLGWFSKMPALVCLGIKFSVFKTEDSLTILHNSEKDVARSRKMRDYVTGWLIFGKLAKFHDHAVKQIKFFWCLT